MTTPATNITGIQEEDKPADSQTQGSTQTTIQGGTNQGTAAASGIQNGVNASVSGVRTQPGAVQPIDVAPVNIATPGPIQPIAPTPSFEAPPPTPEILEPVVPGEIFQGTPSEIVEGPAAAPVPQVSEILEPTLKGPPERGIDFEETEKIAQELRDDEALRLRSETSKLAASSFSQLTHDALSQSRDSGYVNAAKLASIRRSNNVLFDGLASLDQTFTQSMLELSREKVLQQADFDEEAYQEWQSTQADILGSYIDSGNLDAAIEYGKSVSLADPDNPFWDKFNNPDYVANLKITQDKALSNVYNSDIKINARQLAINARPGDLINMTETIDSLITGWDQMPAFATEDALTFFGSLTPSDFEEFGMDDTDQELAQLFQSGEIDWSDNEFKKMYAEAYINYNQSELKKDTIKAAIGADTYAQFSNDPSATKFFDELVNSNFGADGVIGFNGTNMETYGQSYVGSTIINAPGMDYIFQDWDFNPYSEGTNGNNFEASAAEDTFILNEGETGERSYTGEELNTLYEEYHRKQSKRFKEGEDVNPMNMRDFKEQLENILSNEEIKAAIDASANPDDVTASILDGETVGAGGVTIGTNEFLDSEGVKHNFSEFDIDINDFTGRNGKDAEDIKLIMSGDKTIHSLTPDELSSILATDELNDGDIMKALGSVGAITRTSGSIDNFIFGDNNSISVEDNPNNPLTGQGAIDVLQSLENNEGWINIGDDTFRVSGTSTAINGKPGVEWTLIPLGGGEVETIAGEFPEPTRGSVEGMPSFAVPVVSKFIFGDIDNLSKSELQSSGSWAVNYWDILPDNSKKALYDDIVIDRGFVNSEVKKLFEDEFGS